MRKKNFDFVLAAFLLVVLSLGLSSCSKDDDNGDDNSDDPGWVDDGDDDGGGGHEARVKVTTDDDVPTDMFRAKLSGSVSETEEDVVVGFMYSRDSGMSQAVDVLAGHSSGGSFSLIVNGLMDDEDYYYCAYAIVDGIRHKGDVKSFHTEQLKYTLGSRTFKMIKVEGGPDGDFSMMQTELPHDLDMVVGSAYVGNLSDHERGVFVSELRAFVERLREETGLHFRLPTRAEWHFAAGGGINGGFYRYSGSDNIDEVAWYSDNSGGSVHGLAGKKPNELELYDMSGNYAEVCLNDESTNEFNVDGPICGGNWSDGSYDCTVSSWEESPESGTIPGTNYKEKNAYDTKYITVRLVYSRN